MRGIANVGDVLAGKYQVEKILGIGGMGMVVAAMHLELDQRVALKFMLPSALESPEASARFLREARAAGRLTSEHVCRVIDVGRFESGAPYMVMEYLDGEDLGTLRKRRGPLRVSEAVDYVLQACEGLGEAHAHGIIHRDLKPDNLFLASRADGRRVIKVLDFGISKAAVTGIETRTGDVMGSPAYMAPEQMYATKDVDVRADVWSLGVVLYQLLGGVLPFPGDTLPQVCVAVLESEPAPLDQVRVDVPSGLSAVVMRCLSKQPDGRYSDIAELAEALAPFASPEGVGSVTRTRSLLRRRPAAVLGEPDPAALPVDSDVAATLDATRDGLVTPAARPQVVFSAPPVAETTTFGGSAGESLSLRSPRISRGALAGLGAALVIAVIGIAMVVRRGDDRAREAVVPARTTSPGLTVEPLPDPPPSDAAASSAVGAAPSAGSADPDAEPTAPQHDLPSHKPRERRGTAPRVAPDAGAPTPPPDDPPEDQWGHMHHDQPPRKP
ncbi:MAG: serine/threonine-protein kinase [Kofleriaceae bacterium]